MVLVGGICESDPDCVGEVALGNIDSSDAESVGGELLAGFDAAERASSSSDVKAGDAFKVGAGESLSFSKLKTDLTGEIIGGT